MRVLVLTIVAMITTAVTAWYFLSDNSIQKSMSLAITSPAFENNGRIPSRFTCDGKNISPEIIFSGIPADTKSLALTLEDPDVPHTIRPDGMWNHWVVWDIPPGIHRVGEGSTPPGIVGVNTDKKVGYTGPCPPDREHRYVFTLYALNATLSLPEGSTKEELLAALAPHVLETAQLIGRYVR